GGPSKFQQADRTVREAELDSTRMATGKRVPIGPWLAIAIDLVGLPQTELGRQRPDTEPGVNDRPLRERRRVEPAQHLPEHEGIARTVRNRANLVGRPVRENPLVLCEIDTA